MDEISVTDSALLLGKSYNQVMRLVLKGQIRSRRTASGRFLVQREDVLRLAESQPATAGVA